MEIWLLKIASNTSRDSDKYRKYESRAEKTRRKKLREEYDRSQKGSLEKFLIRQDFSDKNLQIITTTINEDSGSSSQTEEYLNYNISSNSITEQYMNQSSVNNIWSKCLESNNERYSYWFIGGKSSCANVTYDVTRWFIFVPNCTIHYIFMYSPEHM